jgi:hypothetical protein
MTEPIGEPKVISIEQKIQRFDNILLKLSELPDEIAINADEEIRRESKRLLTKYGDKEAYKYLLFHKIIGSSETPELIDFPDEDSLLSFVQKLEEKYLNQEYKIKAEYCINIRHRLESMSSMDIDLMLDEMDAFQTKLDSYIGSEGRNYYFYHILGGSTHDIADFDSQHMDFPGEYSVYAFFQRLEEQFLK